MPLPSAECARLRCLISFECTTNNDEATTLDFNEAEDDILPTFDADYLDTIYLETWYPNDHSTWGH